MENIKITPQEIFETLLIDNKPIIRESSLQQLINKCVKRDVPRPIDMDDLFYGIIPNENEVKYLNRCSFMEYYESLSEDFKSNLELLFHCISNDIQLDYVVGNADDLHTDIMRFKLINTFIEKTITLLLPYDEGLEELVLNYINREISCYLDLPTILEFLDSNY